MKLVEAESNFKMNSARWSYPIQKKYGIIYFLWDGPASDFVSPFFDLKLSIHDKIIRNINEIS